jgi:uncharacterized membrane protein
MASPGSLRGAAGLIAAGAGRMIRALTAPAPIRPAQSAGPVRWPNRLAQSAGSNPGLPTPTQEEQSMSNLVVIAFQDEQTAFEMRAALAKMQKEYLIEMEDVVVVTKGDDGKVKLHQAQSLTALGAASGGFWGMLIGMIFLNPLLGAAVGAGAGALSGALTDVGIDDKFMKELGESFQNGCSAIFILVRKATADKVLEGLGAFHGKGKVIQTSLTKDEEDELRKVIEGAS